MSCTFLIVALSGMAMSVQLKRRAAMPFFLMKE
jgi:hypothetical protein